MKTLNVRRLVTQAINRQWSEFERDHPKLAAVLDRDVVIDAIVEHIGHDESFQHALAQAHATGIGIQAILDRIGKLVKRWFRRL